MMELILNQGKTTLHSKSEMSIFTHFLHSYQRSFGKWLIRFASFARRFAIGVN